MSVEVKTTYGGNTDFDIDCSSLVTSSTFIGGRESDEIDNTSTLFVDVLVKGQVTVGTITVADTSILVYVWGSDESLGTTPIDDLDGVDAARTLTNTGVLNSALKIGAVITILVDTDDITYDIQEFSVADLFGGVMPKFWGLYVTHNTGANLNATNDNLFSYHGITYTSA